MENSWNAQLYDGKHGFVSKYGEDVLRLLDPQKGERILDLGCGTGDLAFQIAQAGAEVIGIDHSKEMLVQACEKYPGIEFHQASAEDFHFGEAFDAVFSNATLHWVKDQEAATRSIYQSLKDGGRLVVEFGGKGNIGGIRAAIIHVMLDKGLAMPEQAWYFPSIGEYASLLENTGFRIKYAIHFDRPTLLEGEAGMLDWLIMFAKNMMDGLSVFEQEEILREVVHLLRPSHYKNGKWYADYKRIRLRAIKE